MNGLEFMQPLISDMIQVDPSKRPKMDEVVARFETIRKGLSTAKLRSRIVYKVESIAETAYLTILHWSHRVKFAIRRIPAIPN